MFFPLQLGRNLTATAAGGAYHWLPKQFYPYALAAGDSGGLRFEFGEESYPVEEVAGHLLNFAKGLAVEAVDGVSATETVLTVPSDAPLQQRRALLAAAAIAGLPRPSLIHETSAAALQRSLDLDFGPNATSNGSTVLFYNMGARHVEACVVAYQAATHMGKSTVAMDVLGCGVSDGLGGHQVDLVIAHKMLKAFQEKHPKLADGIGSSVRALKKLEKEAMSLKHVLSANKEGQFRVESLYEDTDFFKPVTRETLEEWCSELFATFSKPIEAAMEVANTTLAAVDAVEMIGGGWRIPRIQSLVSEYLQAQRPGLPALNLSQHVNGDEAMATGAAFFGANSSVSFRTKKIFFTDASAHSYSLELAPLNLSQPHEDGWAKSVALFPAGNKLRAKKTVKLTVAFDLRVTVLEDGNPVLHWAVPGIHEAATVTYVALGTPLISLKIDLDSSGVVQLASATAIFDEPVPEKAPAAANATANATGEAEANATQEQEPVEAPDAAEASTEANETAAANATGGKKKPKMRKRKVPLDVQESFEGVSPRPLSQEEKQAAIDRLATINAADAEARRVEAARNALEAYVYEARGKLSDDENCLQVSTEEDRSKIMELLTQQEEWLYEEEAATANASTLEAKLEALQLHVAPIFARALELETRPLLAEKIEQVLGKVNVTLEYVKKNMTWVDAKEIEGVGNLSKAFEEWWANATENQSKLALTEEPAYRVREVERKLQRVASEAVRLTKIKKIDPMPYSDYGRGYGGYGGYGGGGYDDPKMRAFYENLYKNYSMNGSNSSNWWRNFSNFSNFGGWNDSDYMRSYYEHAARNFSGGNDSGSSQGGQGSGEKTEL